MRYSELFEVGIMNIKLEDIKILEPAVKVIAGFRVINGDIPVDLIIGTAGTTVLIADGAASNAVGNAIEIEV